MLGDRQRNEKKLKSEKERKSRAPNLCSTKSIPKPATCCLGTQQKNSNNDAQGKATVENLV
jgi:hypothetical protein